MKTDFLSFLSVKARVHGRKHILSHKSSHTGKTIRLSKVEKAGKIVELMRRILRYQDE